MIPIFPTKTDEEILDGLKDDRLQSIALGGIRRHAKWLMSSARQIHEHVQILKSLPEWPTEAEEALAEARLALIEAMTGIEADLIAMRVERDDD